jgi:hypothetical protein
MTLRLLPLAAAPVDIFFFFWRGMKDIKVDSFVNIQISIDMMTRLMKENWVYRLFCILNPLDPSKDDNITNQPETKSHTLLDGRLPRPHFTGRCRVRLEGPRRASEIFPVLGNIQRFGKRVGGGGGNVIDRVMQPAVPVGRDLGGIRVPLGIQHPPVSGYFPKTK